MGSEEDTRRNVQSNQLLHQRGYAKMFLIFKSDELVGVLSFNTIEPANKAGYIGYWLDEAHQGQGVGRYLLAHALATIKRLSDVIGLAVVVIDAKNQDVAEFYKKFGFFTAYHSDLRLFLLVKSIADTK